MAFWEKVEKCQHKNFYPDYSKFVSCGTPYCSGHEDHCKDCGAFIAECSCGYCDGISGWSNLRWNRHWRKQRIRDRMKEAL